MSKLKIKLFTLLTVLFLSGAHASLSQAADYSGNCRDPWVTRAIKNLIGRAPEGDKDRGECNYRLYGKGTWSSYNDLVEKVRASLFNSNPKKTKERCFGAQGSGCDALQYGVYNFKMGRTNLGDHNYLMWISVGSIMHDNCCIAYPYGKMCGGNDAAKSLWGDGDGHCVQEWDKAFWNAADGRAWTIKVNELKGPDLTIVSNPRTSKSRNGTVLNFFETTETRKRSAPAGQALDVGDEAFCESGKATGKSLLGKKWIVCDKVDGSSTGGSGSACGTAKGLEK